MNMDQLPYAEEAIFQPLKAHLRAEEKDELMTTDELVSLPDRVLHRAMQELILTTPQEAALLLAIAKARTEFQQRRQVPVRGYADTEHRTAFALIEELIRKMPDPVEARRAQDQHHLDLLARKDYPYKGDRERLLKFLHAAQLDYRSDSDTFLEPLRSTFLVNCKAHNLGPMEIIAGQWTLFTTDKKLGAYLYATILLHPMQSERVRMHNWYMTQDKPEHWLNSFGPVISRLTVPLFPFHPDCESLNNILLNDPDLNNTDSSAISGGRAPSKTRLPAPIAKLYRFADPLVGGGFLPVLDAQGQQTGIVDTSSFEAWVSKLCDERATKTEEEVSRALTSICKGKTALHTRLHAIRGPNQQTQNRQRNQPPYRNSRWGGETSESGNAPALPTSTVAAGHIKE